MRAVVFAGKGRVEVDDVPEPRVMEPGDAIVKVGLTAICGSDLHLLDGKTPGMREGGVIGHEFVGEVVDQGPEATGHPRGTRVLGSFLITCGRCKACRSRRFNHCENRRALGLGTLTGDLDGAQAEYVRIPEADMNLHALGGPLAALSDEQVLFCGDVFATAMYAAHLAAPEPGATVAVVGAGPIGLLTALAVRRDAGRTLVLDTDPTRVEFATRTAGLEAVLVGDDLAGSVRDANGGEPADVAIDAVGAVPVFKDAMRSARAGGRVVVIGVYGAERVELSMGRSWINGLDIRFSGMANVQAHWDEALSVVREGSIDPTAVITHRLGLEQAVEGYDLFAAREAMKVVLNP
ncbi:MAG: alcohol dehydrogenase catalytic domain-containing protein [Actinobacteria bacterium]|nr:alcohol dehydrogenase catalytic domain-containing protein [Actinomycetota bacterium]